MRKQNRKIASMIVVVMLASMILCMMPIASLADEAAPQTREYNEAFDRLLDAGAGAGSERAYRSISWSAGQCDDVTDPVFKVGSPKISAGFESLNIELRSPDGSIKLEDLKIGLRTADSDEIAATNSYVLSHEDIIGGISFSAGDDIGSEFAVMSIDFASTEVKISGNAFDSTVPDAMLAFHLYTADSTVAGKLDIRKVSVTTGSNETVVLDFDTVNEAWWNGGESGTFVDIPKHYAVTDKISIASDDAAHNNLDEKYSAIVLNIAGESATVAPVMEDGTVGAAKAWSELTDLAGTPVAALDGNFRNAVISLESLGAKKIKGVEISGNVLVAGAFFTNLDTIKPDKYFPVLDTESIAYMSQFNFEYLTAGPDYDKAVTDSAPFNCDYILSYSTKNNVIKDGHLVLDAQGEAFTSIKIRSKVASEGRQYLVIKYKLENGATLNDFRFDVLKTDGDTGVGIKYANQLLAGTGLPSLSEANPYHGTNGYDYLVVDLEKTFGERYISGVDMYISGEGQVLIDEIFYAHPVIEEGELGENILAAPQELAVQDADGGYQYLGWIGLDGKKHDGIEIVMRGEGNATLNDVRFEMGGKVTWFADNAEGTFVDSYGRKMPALSAENQVYFIDLSESGITGALNEIHVHGAPVAGGGKIVIESIRYFDYPEATLETTDEVLANDFPGKEVVAGAAGYSYIGWINGSVGNGYKYLIVEVEGDISKLRMEFAGHGVFWIEQNDSGSLRDRDGNLFATSGKQTLVIDLEKSGIVGNLSDIHVHHEFAAAGDVLKITSVKFAKEAETLVKSDEALAEDFPGKEVVAGGAGYAYVGWINGSVGNGYKYLIVEVEGDISKLRMEFAGHGVFWVEENAQGTLRDKDGNLFATSGKQTLVIDLEKSGIVGNLSDIHVHHEFAAAGDVLKITSVKFAKEPEEELAKSDEALAEDFPGKEVVAGAAGYAYVGWINGSVGNGYEYLIVEVEGDISKLRIEFGGIGVFWVEENAQGTLRDRDGNLFATSGKQILVIDLEKSGIVGNLGDIHVHHEFAAAGDVLKITSVKFGKKLVGYEDIVLPENDDCAPVITPNVADTAKLGDEVTLSATATDNYGGDVTIRYEVTFGTEVIEISDGKFVPSKVGTYSVKIIASDGINEREMVVSVVVSCQHADGNNDGKCDACGYQLSNPPVDEPPVDEPPVDEPPVDEPPVDEPKEENPIIAWFIKIFNMIVEWFANLFEGFKK